MADRNIQRSSSSVSQVQVQRRFDVVETKRAPQGHTVYKVLLTVTQSSSDTVTEVSMWQRYSAFVTLHKQLEDHYNSLESSHRQVKFPDFPKAHFFSRFDEYVIDERCQGIVNLLRFTSTVPELLLSKILASFFQCGGVSRPAWVAAVCDPPSDNTAVTPEDTKFQPSVVALSDSNCGKVCVPDSYDLDEAVSDPLVQEATHMPDLSQSPKDQAMADERKPPGAAELSLSTDDRDSSAVNNVKVVGDKESEHPTGDLPNSPKGVTNIWEHQMLDGEEEDASTTSTDHDDIQEDVGTEVDQSHSDGAQASKVDAGSDDTATGSDSSALLTDLSMIDDQLDCSESMDPERGDVSTPVTGDNTPTGMATPQSLSESVTPSGRDSPGMCLSPIRPVARIYSSPGESHAGWFQDAVSASWDDIENRLTGAELKDAGSHGTPAEYSSMLTTEDASVLASERDQPVAQPLHANGSAALAAGSSPGSTVKEHRYERTYSLDSVSKIELSGDGDYVLKSATVIGDALKAEAASDFELAFKLYKAGVGLLLSGVQTDHNESRRDAVRRKTGQYLQRAEQLHNCYLIRGTETGQDRWQDTPRHAPATQSLQAHPVVTPVAQTPSLQLRDFSVIRPLGKLILVQNCHTQDVYVIKTMSKLFSPQQAASKRSRRVRSRNLISSLCPYMVRPIGHFDTSNRLFMLLEHAQRGALWNSLERFQESVSPKGPEPDEQKDADDSSRKDGDESTSMEEKADLRPAWSSSLLSPASIKAVPEVRVRRWAAQIVSALGHLHSFGFIWRDLQPKNLLLDEQDDILLTYASNWEHVDRPFSLWAREHLYTAPELNGLGKATEAADWWSLGAILYELLTGKTLLSCHPAGVSSHGTLRLPLHLSFQASSFLRMLLQPSNKERLGSGHSGMEEIKSHPFFAGVLWNNSH